jgi:hypothetical protein
MIAEDGKGGLTENISDPCTELGLQTFTHRWMVPYDLKVTACPVKSEKILNSHRKRGLKRSSVPRPWGGAPSLITGSRGVAV